MEKRLHLLNLLSDNCFHSGEHLGKRLGVSRTAVWKHIQALQSLGIECVSVSGKGYRLSEPVELLDKSAIKAQLSKEGLQLMSGLELHAQISSTNRHLMGNIRDGMQSGHACLAESQTDGRGRRGRQWLSPFARNIYLSLYWQFDASPAALSGLGLAIGVGIVRALKQLGIGDANLKWPNDVLWQGKKLAGILLEMSAESGGPYHVVIGAGLNVNMAATNNSIDQPWIDLNSIARKNISRNEVAAVVLDQLLTTVRDFQLLGLAPFMNEWRAADAYAQKLVVIHQAGNTISGTASGIDSDGAILIETAKGLRRFHSGDVSLRPSSEAL